MAALTGKTPSATYKDLLQVSNSNSGVDTTMRPVSDGEGTDSALQISNAAVNINGTFQLNGEALTVDASAINAIADLTGTTGIVASNSGTIYGRTITAGSGVSVGNGDGTSGNPTISLNASGVTSASYGPIANFEVNSAGQVVSASDETSITLTALTVSGQTSIAGLTLNGVVSGTTATFSGTVSASEVHGDGSNLTNIAFATSATNASFAISATNATNAVNATFATSASAATNAVSAVFATSSTNASFAISATNATNANNVVGGIVSATAGTFSGNVSAVEFHGDGSNLTGITAVAPTSVADFTTNTLQVVTKASVEALNIAGVVSGTAAVFSGTISATNIALVSGELGGTGLAVMTDVEAVSATMATSIAKSNVSITANKDAIVSVNGVITTLSATMASSISNHLPLSGGTLSGHVSGTAITLSGNVSAVEYYGDGSNLTGIGSNPTSVADFTVNTLQVTAHASVQAINIVGAVSGTSAVFSGNVSAAEYYGDGSNLTGVGGTAPTSVADFTTNTLQVPTHASIQAMNVVGAVSGASAVFSGNVSAAEYYGDGSNLTGIITGVAWGAITGTLADQTDVQAAIDAVSATMATSISNSNSNITTNANAITSINNATTSINSAITTLSATMATSISNSNSAITALSATMATSINNTNTALTALSATLATSIANAAASGIDDIVEDTTPQLGGDLDLNSSNITGTGEINLTGSMISMTDTLKASLITEVNGELLQFGTNYAQAGGHDTGSPGAMFRIDTRAVQSPTELFSVIYQATPGSGEDFVMQLGNQGNLSIDGNLTLGGTVDGVDVATLSSDVTALSATMATSISNSNSAITALSATMATSIANVSSTMATSISNSNSAITALSATMATSISNNASAITALSATMATSIDNSNIHIAAVSVLTSVAMGLALGVADWAMFTATPSIAANTSAIAVNASDITALSATMATSIGNSNSAITALSATMATSISNSNTAITALSATMATSIANNTGGGYFKGENGTTGNSAGDIFRINEAELNTSTSIVSGENGSCTGPLTIASGVTLTIDGTLVII